MRTDRNVRRNPRGLAGRVPFTQRPLFRFSATAVVLGFVGWLIYFLWIETRQGLPAHPEAHVAPPPAAGAPAPGPARQTASSAPRPAPEAAKPAGKPAAARPTGEPAASILEELDAAYRLLAEARLAEAEAAFEKVWNASPGLPGLLRTLVALKVERRMLDDAYSLAVQAQRSDLDIADANMLAALMLARNGDHENAFASLKRAAAFRPADPEIYYHWANHLRLVGNTRESLRRIEQAIARNRSLGGSYLLLTKRWLTLLEMDETAELHRTLDAALAHRPPEANALFVAGLEQARRGYGASAVKMLTEARSRIPHVFLDHLLRDPVVIPLAQRKDLAPLLTPEGKNAGVSFTDDLFAPLPPPPP